MELPEAITDLSCLISWPALQALFNLIEPKHRSVIFMQNTDHLYLVNNREAEAVFSLLFISLFQIAYDFFLSVFLGL